MGEGNKALRPVEILLRPTVADEHGRCPPLLQGLTACFGSGPVCQVLLEVTFAPAILISPINKERIAVKLEQETVAGISLNFRSWPNWNCCGRQNPTHI
jgi:hypothetical protein